MKTVLLFLALVLAAPGLVLATDERDSQTAPSGKTDAQVIVIEVPTGAPPLTELIIKTAGDGTQKCTWDCSNW